MDSDRLLGLVTIIIVVAVIIIVKIVKRASNNNDASAIGTNSAGTKANFENNNIDAPTPNNMNAKAFCVYCGKQIKEGNKFCQFCGKPQQ